MARWFVNPRKRKGGRVHRPRVRVSGHTFTLGVRSPYKGRIRRVNPIIRNPFIREVGMYGLNPRRRHRRRYRRNPIIRNPAGSLTLQGVMRNPLGVVTVTDSIGQTNTKSGLTLIVNAAPAGGCSLTITSTTTTGTTGTPISGSITASGGNGTYTYSVAGGSLPPGVTLDPNTGALSGTPTTAGTYTFSVIVGDTGGSSGAQTFSFTISSGSGISIQSTSPVASAPAAVAASGITRHSTRSKWAWYPPAAKSTLPSRGT